MIKLDNVTKVYDGSTTAVDNISFELKEGEIFGLIGTSGCGKTTTLKMINRLIEPTSGRILMNGTSVIDQPAEQLRRNIGYVIQQVGLFPHYTIKENVALVPTLMNWKKDRIDKRSKKLLNLVGLDAGQFANRKPESLSGGEQQRVGLARALAADPPVLLMDEPFGALDPITKERIRKEVKELLARLQKTVILVTHDVLEAFDLCNRICLMDRGKAQQTGTPKELLFQPKNKFVRSFFDNHRFQLEMMSITIKEIFELLKTKSDGSISTPSKGGGIGLDQSPGDVRNISLEASLFSVFEESRSEEKNYRIVNNDGHTMASINADELLNAFQRVRSKLKEGHHD